MSYLKVVIACCFIASALCAELSIEDREKKIWRNTKSNDTSIRSFKIEFEKETVEDLKYRLNHRRKFTPPLENAAFTYGFNTDILDSWLDYWGKEYKFKEQEDFLNKFPHFKTNIQGLDIHFIRIKPKVRSGTKVLPLILLHGFPGSIREFYGTLPLLTATDTGKPFALEVIVPSLPGFGFSDAATSIGLGGTEMAVVMKLLMERLGYEQFYVQGGDWGSYVGSMIATLYPKVVLGYHTNFPISFAPLSFAIWFAGSLSPSLVADTSVQDRLYPLTSVFKYLLTESGYLHMQSTKPDTIGVAMTDSPAGLLSWVLQLVSMASRRDNGNKTNGGLDLYPRDELIDNLMIYWTTNTFTTGARLYAETFNIKNFQEGTMAIPTPVPTWTAHTKNELIYQSPSMLKVKYPNLLNTTIFDDYGHFFALEQPKVFAENVITALDAFEQWHANKV